MKKTADQQPDLLQMKDITPKKDAAKPAAKTIDAKASKPAAKKPAKPAPKPAPKKTGSEVAVRKKDGPASGKPDSVLAIIARAAADPKINPENMRALLDMQMEIRREDAREAFTRAYVALQEDLANVRITQTGRIVIPAKEGRAGQSTPYAKFNVIMEAVGPLLRKHKFTLSFETEPSPDGTRLHIKGILKHVLGHQQVSVFPLPAEVSGSKNNVQGWGSTQSYGKRYCTIALLNIISYAPEDVDDDGQGGQPVITKEQVKILRSALNVKDVQEKRLLTWCSKKAEMEIAQVEQIPAILFETAHQMIQACT